MLTATRKPWFERVFTLYNRWLIGRTFKSIHVRGLDAIAADDRPTLFLCNHSNWWDGLVLFQIDRMTVRRPLYMMMEEKGLRQYPFFRKLGAFSIDRTSTADIRQSLRYTATLLHERGAMVFLFPQGKIRHQDVRPLSFEPGAALALAGAPDALVCPVSLHYAFREDQRPEVFVSFGRPLPAREVAAQGTVRAQAAFLEKTLTAQLDEQRAELHADAPVGYRNLFTGALSTADWYRRVFQRGVQG